MNTQSEIRSSNQVEELNANEIECVNGGYAQLVIYGLRGAAWLATAAASAKIGDAAYNKVCKPNNPNYKRR